MQLTFLAIALIAVGGHAHVFECNLPQRAAVAEDTHAARQADLLHGRSLAYFVAVNSTSVEEFFACKCVRNAIGYLGDGVTIENTSVWDYECGDFIRIIQFTGDPQKWTARDFVSFRKRVQKHYDSVLKEWGIDYGISRGAGTIVDDNLENWPRGDYVFRHVGVRLTRALIVEYNVHARRSALHVPLGSNAQYIGLTLVQAIARIDELLQSTAVPTHGKLPRT